jgi:hypothetical protein
LILWYPVDTPDTTPRYQLYQLDHSINWVSTGTVEIYLRLSHRATENKSVKANETTGNSTTINLSTTANRRMETNHHRWINLREVAVPFNLSWRNRGHRYVNSHVQIDVVDCGVMTVRFGGFFPDGLALLALRRHILFPLWLFVIIMTFAAIVVPKSPPACVHEVCGGWSCCLWGFRLVVAFCDGRKLIIVISDFGRAERRRTQM